MAPESIELLRNALERNRYNRAAWLVLGEAGGSFDEAERVAARSVWEDEDVPMSVRAAAASAVTPAVGEARAALVQMTQSFLKRFGNRDYSQQIDLYRDAMDEVPAFEEGLRTLGAVGFCRHPVAQELIQKATQTKNGLIDLTAGIIAARRWPEMIADGDIEVGNTEQQIDLWTCVVHFHPDKANQVSASLQPAVNKELESLEEVGLPGVFGWPAKAALGW